MRTWISKEKKKNTKKQPKIFKILGRSEKSKPTFFFLGLMTCHGFEAIT